MIKSTVTCDGCGATTDVPRGWFYVGMSSNALTVSNSFDKALIYNYCSAKCLGKRVKEWRQKTNA